MNKINDHDTIIMMTMIKLLADFLTWIYDHERSCT